MRQGEKTIMNYEYMMVDLKGSNPQNWREIYDLLIKLKAKEEKRGKISNRSFSQFIKGVAFITFDYGIDGVSIEITKYAQSIEALFPVDSPVPIHFVGGDFHEGSNTVLLPRWKRYHLKGSNGWDKWDGGKWFRELFGVAWSEEERASNKLPKEIWKQTVSLAERMGSYISKNNISLIIPVNICSNPGNLAFCLATIIVSEYLGLFVINSNHDFYWEGGKPEEDRKKGESAGVRDHFFRNRKCKDFFRLFKAIYPWDGKRWLQVNINRLQSSKLKDHFNFEPEKVSELSTSISSLFFRDPGREELRSIRSRMAHILSGGEALIDPVPVKVYLSNLSHWMECQHPVVLSDSNRSSLDLTSPDIFYFLQPTRVIARKRIERDIDLLEKLLLFKPFEEYFGKNRSKKILLHITGPVPIEHQGALELVLDAYIKLLSSVRNSFTKRVYLAFSVGNEEHSCFPDKGFVKLKIEDIYRLAAVVLFPSETEGRGLPIIESGAAGIPIICSRYHPQQVFSEVVGEHLDPDSQIDYIEFPEGDFPGSFLKKLTELLIEPGQRKKTEHNRGAVKERYGSGRMEKTFNDLFLRLENQKAAK
jgi:glycosyltransferase involved in cell wall biosynthesis